MKTPKPIRKHVKRINRRCYGLLNGVASPKHKRIKLKEVKWYLRGKTDYCPCCGSLRGLVRSTYACSLCRPDIVSYTQFKQEAEKEGLNWCRFSHKSGQRWSIGY